MNILIFEYITGGGMLGQPLSPSLEREGDLMLRAAVNDFQQLPDCSVFTLRDKRLGNGVEGAETIVIEPGEHYSEKLEQLACKKDALLIIAPEYDDILYSLCKRCSGQTFKLLNCEIETIRLTSNKYATYRHLLAHNVPQIPTCLTSDARHLGGEQFIMKPVDGAGCTEVSLLNNRSELQAAADLPDRNQYIFQPYVQGTHASLSLLCLQGRCSVLSCNEQYIREGNGRLQWVKCNVNAFERDRFTPFCDRLVQALPGLCGYVGVDIVITGTQILLVEINPRLTTSYVGLGSVLCVNPAELILKCFLDRQLPGLVPADMGTVMVDLVACHAA